MPKFAVTRPIYEKTALRCSSADFPAHHHWFRVKEFELLGVVSASDCVEAMKAALQMVARSRAGYSPILEQITTH